MSDERISDPSSHFDSPATLLGDSALSRTDKARALTNWANEIRQLQVAEEENMPGPSDLGERLAAVEAALLELGEHDSSHDAKA